MKVQTSVSGRDGFIGLLKNLPMFANKQSKYPFLNVKNLLPHL